MEMLQNSPLMSENAPTPWELLLYAQNV